MVGKIRQNNFFWILIIGIISVQLIAMIMQFSFDKSGYHIDEIWQYTLSNADEGYGVINDGVINDGNKKMNEWVSGSYFNGALTVQPDEAFHFKNVWYNAAHDTKGPLGYVPLHLIGSFFQNQYSTWQMFSLNLISFFVMMIFVCHIVLLLTKNRFLAMLVTTFFGFTTAAFAMTLFLRMYIFEAMLLVIYTYIILRFMQQEKWIPSVIGVGIMVCLGGLTDYLFLSYAFFVTVSEMLYLLFQKKKKKLMALAASSFAGVLAMIAIFPAAIAQMTDANGISRVWGTPLKFSFQFRMMFSIITSELTGIHPDFYFNMTRYYVLWILIALLVILFLLRFLFRKEPWLQHVRQKIKSWMKRMVVRCKSLSLQMLIFFAASIFELVLVEKRINLWEMNVFSDRYVFPVYPILAMALVLLIYRIALWISEDVAGKNQKLTYGIVIALLLFCVINSQRMTANIYLAKAITDQTSISLVEKLRDKDVIVLCENDIVPVEVLPVLANAHQVYLMKSKEYAQYSAQNLNKKSQVYLLMDIYNSKEFPQARKRGVLNAINASSKDNSFSTDKVVSHFQKLYSAADVTFCGTQPIQTSYYALYLIQSKK